MPKERNRLNSLLHSLPSFNKSDRLSIKVAHLLNVEENTPDEDLSYTMDRRRCNPHRRSLGGRGREWASESLKLLEALLELDDSKPVREPVNPLKYPEYYSRVPNPLDLSKIMLKFHGGSYATLEVFAKDMRSMFNNYKAFFKDANSEIYTQVHRLSWWFEAELTRIDDKWGRVRKTPVINPTISGETPSTVTKPKTTDSPERQILSPSPAMPVISNVHSIRDPTGLYHEDIERHKRKKKGRKIIRMEPAQSIDEPGSSSVPQAVQISGLVSSELNTQPGPSEQLPMSLARLKPETVAQLLGAKRSLVSSSKTGPDLLANTNSPDILERQGDSMPGPSKGPDSKSGRLSLGFLSMSLSVSNIWFGMARIKPKKEAILSETGLQLVLHSGEAETLFTIASDEIVRCVAHFGRSSNKHTLFLFVLPSCMKRLESINQKYANSSMIVVFMSAYSQAQISTLVHIFWTIGKNSLFGPIFTEVDQQGALMLLGNIKPGIMSRVANKYKSGSANQTSEANSSPNRPGTSELSLPPKRRKVSQDGLPNFQMLQEQQPIAEVQEQTTAQSGQDQTAEAESAVMPDSSMSVGQEEAADGQNLNVQRFDKDFAERLGASLQQGFKDGFTEVIKNLTDTLYGKRLPTDSREEESGTEAGNFASGGDDNNAEESDIEIVIPTDSEEDDKPKSEIIMETDNVAEGEDLSVTMEKPRIRCPITQQIMKRPLKNKHCNHCYDMQGVEELIKNRKQRARCPVAGCSNTIPLVMMDMKYEHALFKYIKEKTNPQALDLSSVDKKPELDSE